MRSNAFFNPSFSALAEWEEDPSEILPMLSFTRSIVFGFLKFEIKSSHSISMILSWLENALVQ